MCWSRLRSTRPIPTAYRAAWSWSRATSSACRSGRARWSRWCGRENANPDPRLHNRLKDVGEKLDVPPLKEELRKLVDWVSTYTLSARGMVLRMACGWANISDPSGCGWVCGWSASRRSV